MNRFLIARKTLFLTTISVCVLMVGCASAPRLKHSRQQNQEQEDVVAESPIQDGTVEHEDIKNPGEESYGPDVPPGFTGEVAAPAPEVRQLQLCLILGPGMARGIAHAGVMEQLSKAKIPVHCVVGTEMGAVVGALYANSVGNVNQVLWQLFKIKKDGYLDYPLLSMRGSKARGEKFHKLLLEFFADKKIESLPIRFSTSAADKSSGSILNFSSGNLVDALSATTAIPDLFEEWVVGSTGMVSGANFTPVATELAKELGGNFFVFVDVLGAANSGSSTTDNDQSRYQRAFVYARNLIKLQRKEADVTISVNVGALGYDDFARQGDFLAAGRKAADAALPELQAKINAFNKVEPIK